jgi:serine/threonine-protein kinase
VTSDRWERIKDLFEETLRRAPSERASFLGGLCAADEDLRTEVMRLILQHESAGDFLESPPFPVPPQGQTKSAIALTSGARLGPYEIVGLAGRGGMGEVYRARDTRLGRQVAIKVIGASLEGDPNMQRRFEEEVRLAASLDHPRICAVYDVGQHDGIRYFVMEFLQGESLAARLAKGPLPTGELLEYAVDMASALAHAHRHHILHRDVKPANVFLTPQGVKVMDFGLAKICQKVQQPSLDSNPSKELRPPLTRPGFFHGTPEYVPPERLEGREGDHRSDIFAFGAVLYEMATGRRAFDAPTPAALVAAILSSEPPSMSGGTAPPELEWVVRRCLRKSPDARWESMSDVEAVLKWFVSRSGSTPATLDADSTGHRDRPLSSGGTAARANAVPRLPGIAAWAIITVLVCGAIAIMTARSWRSAPAAAPAPVVRFTLPVEPVPTTDFGAYLNSRLAISRDGRRLAYVSRRVTDKIPGIFVRHLESPLTTSVEGTEGATGVFFSPDGEQLGFFAEGKMKRVAFGGGAVLTICDVPQAAGASWGDDNAIVFAPTRLSVLMRVASRQGSIPAPVTSFRQGEVSHRFPDFVPGGNAIIYAAGNSDDFTSARIVVESLKTGERTELFEGTYPRYVWNGHLVFAREASLFALPFDPVRLRPEGPPQSLVTNLRINHETGSALFAVSDSTLVYRSVRESFVPRLLVWVDMDGREETVPMEPRPAMQPRLSRDGTRVAFTVGQRGWDHDLWTYTFAHRLLKRLTVEPGEEETPVWSPEGRRVAFSASRAGQPWRILAIPADGGSGVTLGTGQYMLHVSDWSQDGRYLAWTEFNPPGGQIRVAAVDGSREVRTVVAGAFDARGAVFSPDGRWIAFTSNETGRDEVYVQSYPGSEHKRPISVRGGREPSWSPSGDRVYFRGQDSMWGVDVRTAPTFASGTPRRLFADPYEWEHGGGGDRNYDISADGRRFLMLKAVRPHPPAELTVVMNWATTMAGR